MHVLIYSTNSTKAMITIDILDAHDTDLAHGASQLPAVVVVVDDDDDDDEPCKAPRASNI